MNTPIPDVDVVRGGDPQIARHPDMERTPSGAYVHKQAIVERGAEIGEGTVVWALTYVMALAQVGKDCMLGQGVHIGAGAVVGDRCSIQNAAQLFVGVALEDDVFVGPGVVFTNVRVPRAFVNRKIEMQPTLVKQGASIGANATIRCGITINEYAMIGAGAVVTEDVPAYILAYGNPATSHRWVCRCGEILPKVVAPTSAHVAIICPACHTEYAASLTEGLRAKTPA